MGFVLPAGVVNTNTVYYYAVATSVAFGPLVKEPNDQTLVMIDYSTIAGFTLSNYNFGVDVSSNPQLVVSFPSVNASGTELRFLLSGGIPGQQYTLTISASSGATLRVDKLTISVPSSGDCDCETINPVPALLSELPLGGGGYANTAIRLFWGSVPPANPNALDQWYDTTNLTTYEWITDGTTYFWSLIASPETVPVPEAPNDGQLYGRKNSAWVPIDISSIPSTVTISLTPPVSPIVGSLWFDSSSAQVYVWYDDGNSRQWVPVVNQAGAGGSVSGSSAPANTSPPAVTGTASVGQTLSCYQGTWTGSPTSYVFQWERNLAPTIGATASTYLLVSGDGLQSVSCAVTATNASGSATAMSNAVVPTVPPAPAIITAPVVSGTATVGQTLSCSTGSWANAPTSYAYQWRRNGVAISGATTSTYLLDPADGLKMVDCVVTATNASGNGISASNALSILSAPPVNTSLPVITGTVLVGQTVSCTTGAWSNGPTSYTYQWRLDGADISGATAPTYRILWAQSGHNLACNVTATNAGGSASAATAASSVPAPYALPIGAQAIYSLRATSSTAYALNKCVNVKRFSDGAIQDIGFDAYGMVDMAVAATFANGSILYVLKWYDQSGNARDAVQSSYTSAPQLFNFNGPQIAFANLTSLQTPLTGVTLTGDHTIGMSLQLNCNDPAFPLECWDTSHGWAVYLNGSGAGNISTVYDGSVSATHDSSNMLAGSVHQVAITRASGSVKIYADGAQTATGTSTNGASTAPMCLGSYQGSSFPFHGLISEVYLYAFALSPTQIADIRANEVLTFPQTGFQNYYNGSTALQFGQANYLLFGNILNYEYNDSWTMYAAIQLFSVSGSAEAGVGANIDHFTGPIFCGWLVSNLLTGAAGGANPPGAPCVRLIHDLSVNQHLMVEGQETLCTGKYRLLTVTYNGNGLASGVKLYIDGVAKPMSVISDTLGALSIKDGTQKFAVGGQANDGGNMINGRIGFFQIDRNVATPTYIASNFSTANPGPPPNIPGTTDIRLLMTEGAGTTVGDTSGNNRNGTLTSAAMWTH